MNYIDADKLKVKIKGLQCEQGFEDGETERGYQFAIKDILGIIDSLQQEMWKPSEEQMRALEDAKIRMSLVGHGLCPLLQTLINDLKSL